MLQFVIAVSKSSDILPSDETTTSPLNARSLALSAMLGTHPPTLSARALVDLAEVFGINGGTMRTALSRLVNAGDVVATGGRYTLAPRLLERQAAQDVGRASATSDWAGSWHTAIATADHRDLADRRLLRTVMANARFGELRPSVWLRPANLPAPALGDDWLVTTGPVAGQDQSTLATRLWELEGLATTAHALIARIDTAEIDLDPDDSALLPPAFSLSAEIVRFLRADPLLPPTLTPPDWPVDELRHRYDGFERSVQAMLRPILTDTR